MTALKIVPSSQSLTAQPYRRFMVFAWSGRGVAGISRNLAASYDSIDEARDFVRHMRSGYAHRVDSFEVFDRVDGVTVDT
jgi:hypothetical protein